MTVYRLPDLEALAQTISLEEYVERYPFSVLVARKIMGGQLQHQMTENIGRHKAKPKSTMLHMDPVEAAEAMDPCDSSMMETRPLTPARVFPVRKRSRGIGAIRIGRLAINDVVINDYTVSKHHADLVWDSIAQRHSLIDQGSTNGTAVGTLQLEDQDSCAIQCGYWLVFGRVVCEYLTAATFYQKLRDA